MAKRKAKHQLQRNVVVMAMMQNLGGKSVGHKSKKDYRRKAKHKTFYDTQGRDSRPFFTAAVAFSALMIFATIKLSQD
jgi:hypothetical protein